MRKGYFVFFAVLLGLLMPCDEGCAISCAKPEEGHIDQEVVPPLLQYQGAPICWNFVGTVSGEPYFNVSLDKVAKGQEGLQHAQAGCVNTSMGTIMYANAYPSASALPGEALDTDTEFTISVGNLLNPFNWKRVKMKGGSDRGNFYKWDLMIPYPVSSDLSPVASADPRRDEMAVFLRDIGAAMRTEYKSSAGNSYFFKAPGILKKYFFYKDARYYGCNQLALFFNLADLTREETEETITPSLEMGMPVMIQLAGFEDDPRASHAIVVDGYAYASDKFVQENYGGKCNDNFKKLLYHLVLNEGDRSVDGWYDLEDRTEVVSIGRYTKVTAINYNICSKDEGGVIGGRLFLRKSDGELELLSGDACADYEMQAQLIPFGLDKSGVTQAKANGHYALRYPIEWGRLLNNAAVRLINKADGAVLVASRMLPVGDKDDDSDVGHLGATLPGIFGGTYHLQSRNFWPVDFILDESVVIGTGADTKGLKALIQSSENASDDSGFNQWCLSGFGKRLNSRWTGEGTDAFFVDTFPYNTFLSLGAGRFPWIGELMTKAEKVAADGGIVFICGESWPFAQRLAARAGKPLGFYSKGAIRHTSPNAVGVDLKGRLAKETGMGRVAVQFTPDLEAPLMYKSLPDGIRILAMGEVVVLTGGPTSLGAERQFFPMAVEFDLGKGKVIYTSFTADPNLSVAASPEAKKLMRELVAGPVRYAQERRTTREAAAELSKAGVSGDAVQRDSLGSMELGRAASRDFEVECSLSGDVTFVLQVTDQRLGLDLPPTETLHALDVSLFTPDGELFARQKLNGTRASFAVSADVAPEGVDRVGTWRMKLNEAKGFMPRQVVVAFCLEGVHPLDNGDPGYDPNAWQATLNVISGDDGANVLVGASNPASVDVFIGGPGDDTYVGGSGENLYTWELRGGDDTIVNDSAKSTLWIGSGVELSAMGVERVGKDIVITLLDENKRRLGSVTVRDWYSGAGKKLREIAFADGLSLTAEEVESWAAGGVTPPASGDVPVSSDVPIASIVLTPSSLTLRPGETAQPSALVAPPDATDKRIVWSTSAPAVATVSGGSVQAVGVGTAQITATSAADATVRAVCSVTVRKQSGGGGTVEELAHYREKYPGRNVLIASEGDSELLGTDGADVLVGSAGDNWLEGKEGDDIYVQTLGGGHDTISNRSSGAQDVDELHFGPGIVPETVWLRRSGGDLVFSLPNERGAESASTTVEDWYRDARARLDRVVFVDGTVWTAEETERRVEIPFGVQKGGSGADRMKTRSRKGETAVLYGLEGEDRLKGGRGDDVFVGGPGDDFIHTWSLFGGKSHKTFIWNRGDGEDTVDFYFFGQKSGQRRGVLRLGPGIAPKEVHLERHGGSVKVVLPGGSVTFKKAGWFTGFHHPDAIVFADGTTWQWKDVPQR
ncbi:C10 family peptidase [Fretibacterium fastidiosum]|uniref:C10 family peptidase n=1 Tax=Fretibacterium fastidiosum TaxID=651822 RepID=UPI001FB1883C|nr:C10 family peptidase [Fretibacterium fastidiosum]